MIDSRMIRIMNKSDVWLSAGFPAQMVKLTIGWLCKRFAYQTYQRLANRLNNRMYSELGACVNVSISAQTYSDTIICIAKANYKCAFSLLVSQSIIQFISQSIRYLDCRLRSGLNSI